MSMRTVRPGELVLVLGGVRSGKSRIAEELARESGRRVVYIATARPIDADMRERIARHRRRRDPGWRTVEAPIALPETVRREGDEDSLLLVECLGVWLTNLLVEGVDVAEAEARLEEALGRCRAACILVSSEAGSGVIPASPLARRFVDQIGALNQRIAARAERVVLAVAGLPWVVKDRCEEGGSCIS